MESLQTVAKKWQKKWQDTDLFKTKEDPKKKKLYILEMFPYPSGSGLHMGHARNYTIGDVYARFKRMQGFNVLYPMGYDAFGLPAENAAIKAKSHPRIYTEKAIKNFERQQQELGLSYDWSRMISTCATEYYRWNQWFFVQFFKKGLAYKKQAAANWCNSCQTVLANEQVKEGACWRCHNRVQIKHIDQWFFKITQYANHLLRDIDKLEHWPERIKSMQKNWIGRSEGVKIEFPLSTKYKYVLLHGFTGSPDKEFFPWLKESLEERGHTVYAPKLPHTDNPTEEEQVSYILKNAHFDENTVLFGHSLGSVVALKVLEKLEKPIAGLVTAGGFIDIERRKIIKKTRAYDKTFTWKFNTEKIKKNCGFIKILADKNDKHIPLETARRMQSYLGGDYREVSAEDWHFCGEKEPTILEALVPTISVFTTRPDTLYGVTFLTLAPEHPLVAELVKGTPQEQKVKAFIDKVVIEERFSRAAEDQEKEGLSLGTCAVHPLTGEEIPLYTANFVLMDYGTGVVMGVPAHDQRDYDFAKKYKIPITTVIQSPQAEKDQAYTEEGTLINSDKFNGLPSTDAKEKITDHLIKLKKGQRTTNFKIRDWLISRQRYWGTPIPIIYCQKCGMLPVPEKDLPVLLPEKVTFTGEGNPLANTPSFVSTSCPKCKGPAKRETDTMDTFVDSSWYFLRYCDPHNDKKPFDQKKVASWLPVDQYIGGAEHAVMHLLYARFFTKVLKDLGLITFDEPFIKLFNQGMLHKEGFVMSKSRGNVVTQEEMASKYGIDTARVYLMSMASPEKDTEWDDKDVEGSHRFLQKVIYITTEKKEGKLTARTEHKQQVTIKEVTTALEEFRHHDALRALMQYATTLALQETVSAAEKETVALLLAPFAPHLAEECWGVLRKKSFISIAAWPVWNEKKIDQKIDAADELLAAIRTDIGEIMKLVKIVPNSIKLIVSPAWKYKFMQVLKTAESRDMKLMISKIKDKTHLKEGMPLIQSFIKGNLSVDIRLTQHEEMTALEEMKRELEREFKAKVIIERAEDSKEQKARNALPGKPAILLS